MYVQGYGSIKADSTTRTSIAASTVPPVTPQIAKNLSRQLICLYNGGTSAKFYVAFGSTLVSSTNYTVLLNPGDFYESPVVVDAISVVANSTAAADFLYITEMN